MCSVTKIERHGDDLLKEIPEDLRRILIKIIKQPIADPFISLLCLKTQVFLFCAFDRREHARVQGAVISGVSVWLSGGDSFRVRLRGTEGVSRAQNICIDTQVGVISELLPLAFARDEKRRGESSGNPRRALAEILSRHPNVVVTRIGEVRANIYQYSEGVIKIL